MPARVRLAWIGGVGVVALIIAGLVITRQPQVATPSPSPSPASPSPTLTATATATSSPTESPPQAPSPSPAAQSNYMSKRHGYGLTLTPPWHRAICGSTDIDWPGEEEPEQFTSADAMTEFLGHVGFADHRVTVDILPNPERRSPMTFSNGRNPIGSAADGSLGPDEVRSTTLDGRPAAEFGVAGGVAFGYLVGDGERMVMVHYVTARHEPAPGPAASMTGIVRSLRFLSQADRDALPDRAPIPAAAPTVEALAQSLKTAFERKDVAALERLLGPCINSGAESAGGSQMPRERYVVDLRKQFAAGLTVTVDASRITEGTWRPGDTFVRSQWNAEPAGQIDPPPSPGAQIHNVELMLTPTTGGFYMRGTMRLQPER